MPLVRMEHYLVLTDDIDGTRDFYRDALGMQVGPRPSLGFPGYWMYVGDTACIHIGERKAYTEHSRALGIAVSERAPGTGPVDHIAFNGVDFEDISARLQAHGVEAGFNVVPGVGLRQLFLSDPNGVKLEINIPPAS
jgi:catechol 2,3-dioxygenase-like lactoylglutathione lyase family enzyme